MSQKKIKHSKENSPLYAKMFWNFVILDFVKRFSEFAKEIMKQTTVTSLILHLLLLL